MANKSKKKNSLLTLMLIFLVIEFALVWFSGNFTKELVIGVDKEGKFGEKGKFVITHQQTEFDLQQKISEEFQIDDYVKEHGHEKVILGSEHLYNFFAKFTKTPIGTYKLLKMLLILDIILLLIAVLVKKSLFDRPSKPQILFEMIYTFFEDFVGETLGKDRLHFTPYVVTIFIFIWSCNMIGLVPIPGFMEPTRNLNVPLGMGILAVGVVHFMAIKVKGLWPYLKGYAEPLPFLAPLNFIGEIAKAVSIAFRLFGNILGGAIIILVVSSLVKFIILPVGLGLFFGVFVGTVQAFVFTMLALTYIGVEINEE